MPAVSLSHRQAVDRTPPVRHLRRAFGHERSTVCRAVDRARSRALLGLTLCLLAASVVAAMSALTMLDGLRADAHRLAAHRHQVTATLVTPAPEGPAPTSRATGVWTVPAAPPRTGVIDAPSGTPAGTEVPLWVDDAFLPARPARSDGEMATTVSAQGIGVFAALGGVAWVGYQVRRRALDRRALRSWESDWAAVEPQWSGRRL
ncbi:hypothetical protein KCMC57_up57590 [Kitasatospora sp. CMC57]|uniref:Transmembrane protein n=1 Tax=Kitasatospora sp. CMC57 TaxID=3231513 RepID=A0AB33K2C7_9ACTN